VAGARTPEYSGGGMAHDAMHDTRRLFAANSDVN
jgi:hypothetical protein